MLKVVEPGLMTELISNNAIPEPSWSGSAAKGDIVSFDGYAWEAMEETAAEPDDFIPSWLFLGAANDNAMFDRELSTSTKADGDLEVVFKTGRIDTIAFFGVVGDTISVEIYSPEGWAQSDPPEHTFEKTMSTRNVTNWWRFFFGRIENTKTSTFSFPLKSNSVVRFLIKGEKTECSAVIWGESAPIACIEGGAKSTFQSRSKKSVNEFGRWELIKRGSSNLFSATMTVDFTQLNEIARLRKRLDAVPALWIALERENGIGSEIFNILGHFEEFDIDIQYENYNQVTLSIQELTS